MTDQKNSPPPPPAAAPPVTAAQLAPEDLAREFGIALADQQLSLNYQPIVNLRTGLVVGFETLMRWNHPTYGFISPGMFIPVAEQTGMIVEASRWALKEAVAALKRLESHVGHNDKIYMSVNFSPKDLAAESFLDEMYYVISASDVRPVQIQLEITGDLLRAQSGNGKAQTILGICRKTGLKIAVDDYGLGNPDIFLGYMDEFPISAVKIDHLVVREILSNPDKEELVKTIILEARKRNIDVIAEGVEHANEAHKLLNMGCLYGQGYLFTKPLPERELTTLLLNISGFSDRLKETHYTDTHNYARLFPTS